MTPSNPSSIGQWQGCIAWHGMVLMAGGHWTYAEVSAGHWVKGWLHLARNPYDRFGHLFQGFVPVLIFREELFRKGILKPGGWSIVVLIFMALGLSADRSLDGVGHGFDGP
jgi:putative membrane protein